MVIWRKVTILHGWEQTNDEALPCELIKIVCHFSGYILNFHSALYLS